jgi:glycosyl transferase family 87
VSKALTWGSQILPARALAKPQCVLTALWLILGVWGWLWLGPIWMSALWPTASRINDFYQDWGSARNHLIGTPVYTRHTISIPQHLGLPSNPIPSIEYNAHPPTSVLLALPLAQLNYPDAVLVWNIVSLVALLAAATIVVRELAILPRALPPMLALLAFCHPIYANIYQGQLTLVLVLLVTIIWALERSHQPAVAGLFLGAAVAIKLFPAYLAIYFAARGRLQLLLAGVLSFLALTVVTAFVLGFDTYHDYIFVVLANQAKFRSFAYNLSLAGFWHKLFDPVDETGPVEPLWFSPALACWGTLASNLVMTIVVIVMAYRASSSAQRDFAFASATTAMLLSSPVTWDFSLPLLLVPIALMARRVWTSQAGWTIAALLVILAIDWIPQNLLTELCQAGRSSRTFPWTFMLGAPSLKFYALLGTFLLGLAFFKRELRADAKLKSSTRHSFGQSACAVTHVAASPG